MAEPYEKWLHKQLNKLLGFNAADLVAHMASFGTAEKLAGYLAELQQTGAPSAEALALAREAMLHKHASDTTAVVKLLQAQAPAGVIVTKKNKNDKNKKLQIKTGAAASKTRGRTSGATSDEAAAPAAEAPSDSAGVDAPAAAAAEPAALKVRNLGALGNLVLPRVSWCECQAARHALLTNCLSCGKVVCEQEGWGPCAFCGTMLGSKTQVKRDRAKVEARAALAAEAHARDLAAATQRKDKLLQYDRDFMRKAGVIDDQADYYSHANVWLSEAERAKQGEQQRARADAARAREDNKYKVTFDLAGRRVLLTSDAEAAGLAPPVPLMIAPATRMHGYAGLYRNPSLERPPPVYAPSVMLQRTAAAVAAAAAAEAAEADAPAPRARRPVRVQHDDYFPLDSHDPNRMPGLQPAAAARGAETCNDDGSGGSVTCLSLHQPWASLLVHGIKRVEGRSWPTEHRGRLWIAAAAHEPTEDEIASVEAQYESLYASGARGAEALVLPEAYPVAALLGCVDLDACLSQDEYRAAVPAAQREENDSAFLFMCSHARRLRLPITVSGQHKLWPLSTTLRDAALAGLMA